MLVSSQISCSSLIECFICRFLHRNRVTFISILKAALCCAATQWGCLSWCVCVCVRKLKCFHESLVVVCRLTASISPPGSYFSGHMCLLICFFEDKPCSVHFSLILKDLLHILLLVYMFAKGIFQSVHTILIFRDCTTVIGHGWRAEKETPHNITKRWSGYSNFQN